MTVASAATPATVPDFNHPTQVHVEDAMALDFAEQLLTPENSRSETSSNNEHASTEEKPTLRRTFTTATRVTRASLRATEQLDGSGIVFQQTSTTSTAATTHCGGGINRDVDGVVSEEEEKEKKSALVRDSVAVMDMESSTWTEATLVPPDNNSSDHYEPPMAPDTPVSKTSREPQHEEDTSTSVKPQALRKLMEKVLTTEKENKDPEKGEIANNADNRKPLRRSTRLSLIQKTSDVVGKARSVLGKHSRDASDKGKEKENDRRASLRPRKPVGLKEEPAASSANEPPTAKKQRVSESESPSKSTSEEEGTKKEEAPAPKPVIQNKQKKWLTHGLYAGQEQTTETRPCQNKRKNSRRRGANTPQRKLLPMPMFAGDRLLKNGRDFNLPFDIFSPLSPGQPKPDEWRKTNKSTCPILPNCKDFWNNG